MGSVILKLWGFIYLLVVLAGTLGVLLIHLIFGVPFGILWIVMAVLALPASVYVLGKLRKAEIKKPDAKLHAEYMEEIRTKGYTPRFFELAEQAVSMKQTGGTFDFVYLKDFVIYTADYYNMVGQSDKALSYLNVLDRNEVMSKSIQFMDKGTTILLFYNVLMEAYRGTKDRAGAEQAWAEVQPYVTKTHAIPALNTSAQMIRYHYYMLTEDDERAKQVIDEIAADNSPQTQDIMTRYTIQADYALSKGDKEAARKAMTRAEQCCREGAPILREIYNGWMKRFGLTEE